DYIADEMISIKYESGQTVLYHVGTPEQINDIVKSAAKGDKIEVLKGDIALSIPVGGVEVSNTGDGDVTVNDEAVTKGTPVVTTEPAQQPTTPSQPETAGETEAAGNSAKTGDDFNMTAVIALMGIAAAAAAGTVVYGRRKRSN
ncbi:MAG: LPXTG cell wall anchor domain-containing protein, partial [Anaerovoracaceae bacterium]